MKRILRLSPLVWLLVAIPVLAGPAERAYKKRDLNKAKRLYEDRLRDHPDDQRSRYNLGNVLYRSSDLKAAEESWQAALRSPDPHVRSRAAHNLGNAQLQAGQLGDAIGSYIQALKAEPGNMDSKYNLELALRMLKEQQQKQQKKNQNGKENPQQGNQSQQQQQQQQQQGKEQQKQEGRQGQQQDEKQQEKQANQKESQSQGQEPQPAPGDYSREQAERVLDGLKQEEQQLQADRLRSQGSDLRVEKDW